MHRLTLPALRFILLAPLALTAQTSTITGTLAIGGGAALLDGDRAAFQHAFQHKKDGYGGIEQLLVKREGDESVLRFEARFLPGDEDYRLAARWEKFNVLYVDAGYQEYRTYYDGSGGYFIPRSLSFSLFDPDLRLDRGRFWLEIGTLLPDKAKWRLRYQRDTRDGSKGSTRWGDTNLVGAPFGTRGIAPSFYLIDEVQDVVAVDVSGETEKANWTAGARYARSKAANRHVARRRPFEPQDRTVTSRDEVTTDLFSAHGYYDHVVNEQLRYATGGLITTLDTNLGGSRLHGAGADAAYDPAFARRQAFDLGFYGLSGGTRMKQYVGNVNFTYTPAKHWSIRPSLKYEHLREDSVVDYFDTSVGAAPALASVANAIEANNTQGWNEFTEEIEVRYTRWANWNLNARAQWNQGTGNLVETSVIAATQARVIDRDTEHDRFAQKYTFNASWHPRVGLTFAAQYYYKLKLNDYTAKRDNTSNVGTDRYPFYIVDQDVETNDLNVRVTWRAASMLTLVTRYDYEQSKVTSSMAGLPALVSGRLFRHVGTQSITWNPTPRLYLAGNVNVTYDVIAPPRSRTVVAADQNYVNASLGAGYALGKITDLHLDYTWFRADNYRDVSLVTQPLNVGQKQHIAFLTWMRRQSDRLIYTVKYGYGTNRDETFAGLNDYDAHMIYAKVQYGF